MVEVRFACISSVPGVKCTLDGATKYSDSAGLASFFGVSQGSHSYSIVAPEGWRFVSGEDVFGRPLYKSGTTIIEWVPYPEIPWPENQPWMMKMNFEEVGIPTATTISAPDTVEPGQTFNISGILYEKDSGIAIPGQSINLSYNGKSLGTATTGIDGDYLKQASIPTAGVQTLKAEFLGAAGYAASSGTTRMGVGVPLVSIPYTAIASILTGLAIAHFPRR